MCQLKRRERVLELLSENLHLGGKTLAEVRLDISSQLNRLEYTSEGIVAFVVNGLESAGVRLTHATSRTLIDKADKVARCLDPTKVRQYYKNGELTTYSSLCHV